MECIFSSGELLKSLLEKTACLYDKSAKANDFFLVLGIFL